jgi:serine/threonine-protein kinase
MHESSAPTNPSSWVKDLDPLAERVILRCLEKDPAKRLSSAKKVADALPGGDPLAAALALGETPSPEMVAAAGQKTGMKPKAAIACLAAVIVGLVIYAFLRDKTSWEEQVLRENSPDTLAHKSRDLINRLGYTSQPTDSACGLSPDDDYLQDKSVNRWSQIVRGQPAATYFWYRQSPQYLGAKGWSGRGEISPDDPPLQMSGEAKLRLDPHGRLLSFQAVPPQLEMEGGIPTSPDWEILFAAAGLDPMRFTTTEPKWTPPTAFDARAAWTGTYPDQPEIPLRIEAAAWRGKLVYFQLVNKWTRPERVQDFQANKGQRIFVWIVVCLFISILLGAVLLARHNFRQGRGDRRGAFRLALFVFAVSLLRVCPKIT